MQIVKNAAITAISAIGAAIAVNQLVKPSKTHGIANSMRMQLDDYNTQVQPVRGARYVCTYILLVKSLIQEQGKLI